MGLGRDVHCFVQRATLIDGAISHSRIFVISAAAPGSRTGQPRRAQEGSLGVDRLSLLANVAAKRIACQLVPRLARDDRKMAFGTRGDRLSIDSLWQE